MDRFELSIELGNAAMQTAEDVAVALEGVAQRLRDNALGVGAIMDENGNRVGRFFFSERAAIAEVEQGG